MAGCATDMIHAVSMKPISEITSDVACVVDRGAEWRQRDVHLARKSEQSNRPPAQVTGFALHVKEREK